jgi:tetratricopeptide (TPR) repeat protein
VDRAQINRTLNKEVLLLVLLSAVAAAAFVFTRRAASMQQRIDERVAAVWFERGQQFMNSGQVQQAIEAYRKATAGSDENRRYTLALAGALMASNNDVESQQLLLQLREAVPENPEINVSLARLAAKDGDVQEAIHYYQNALYGRWPADATGQRRNLRIELVRFLLARQRYDLASSELLILQGSTPNSATAHAELANFFSQAGDLKRAQSEYLAATGLDDENFDAFLGAGETSFGLQDYPQADRYLTKASELDPTSQRAQQLLAVTKTVLDSDPLGAALSPPERLRRLQAMLNRSLQRLDACATSTSDNAATAQMQSLRSDGQSMQAQWKHSSRSPDSDAVASGVGLAYRMQQAASTYCGEPQPEDQALLLIGREHSGARP